MGLFRWIGKGLFKLSGWKLVGCIPKDIKKCVIPVAPHTCIADFSGMVKGTITVEELTSLKSTSRVEGELVTKQLYIEVGALFTGKCEMGKVDTPKVEKK